MAAEILATSGAMRPTQILAGCPSLAMCPPSAGRASLASSITMVSGCQSSQQ